MAIAFDTATAGGYTAGTSHTFSHTCTGTNLILFVQAETNVSADRITGATYNGVSMTQINKTVTTDGNRYLYLFYLIAPATGANNVVVSASSSTQIAATAASYTGVVQTSPIDNNTTGSFVANPIGDCTTTLNVGDANAWTILVTAYGGTIASTGVTNATRRVVNTTYLDGNIFDNNSTVGSTGNYSMTINNTGTGGSLYLVTIMASFKPASTTNIKSIDGLAYASIKSINGLAIASVKSVDGLA